MVLWLYSRGVVTLFSWCYDYSRGVLTSRSISTLFSWCFDFILVVLWLYSRGVLTLFSWCFDFILVAFWLFSWCFDFILVVFRLYSRGVLTLFSWRFDFILVVFRLYSFSKSYSYCWKGFKSTQMLENQRICGSWRIFLKNSRKFNCSGQTRDSWTTITKQKTHLWIIPITTQY